MITIKKSRTQVTSLDDILLLVAKFTTAIMNEYHKEMKNMKVKIINKLTKIGGSKALGLVVSISSLISTVDGFVSERKSAKEFEEMKKTVSELQKVVSELQNKN